ncbi:MAG: LuxR C-terminal-related transcriptional regulator [Solirubrobacteraceae bacterium]
MDEGTKPTESSAQSHIIKRPRLTKLLDDSGARLILLVAPAGYGKTTLARQWLAMYQRPVAWYRASTASADVAALATGLAAEIDAAIADGTTVTTDRMTSLAAVQQRPDVLARALSRSRETWPRRLVIAIDDYHQVSGSTDAETFVGELVGLLSATFVITTRTRPVWCTPRQAVYGEVVEVGTAELTMTEDEAKQVFGRSSRIELKATAYETARGWPVVIGLAARTGRTEFPNRTLPRRLYEYLTEELVQATGPGTQRALTVLALCGTNDQALARELLGDGAHVALIEAETRGLLAFEGSTGLVLHPLLAVYLIARLRESGQKAIDETVGPLVDTLMRGRRWDDCLVVAEAMPDACAFATEVLASALQELLSTGRVATVRRWVNLARGMSASDSIVELADAEVALRSGEYVRAFAVGSHAAARMVSRDLRSRAELVAGRGAHLAENRAVAKSWFKSAEASAESPQVHAAALWGLVVVHYEEEADDLEEVLQRFADASDLSREHELRLLHGRMLVALAKGDLRRALDFTQAAVALVPASTDPFVNLAVLNQHTGVLAYAARYDEALRVADRFVEHIEASGNDFALSHGLLAKVRALIGLRRFADAREFLGQVMTRQRVEAEPWVATYAQMSHARLQISLGDLDRARDHLAFEPNPRASAGMRAEFDAHRALIEAALGNAEEAKHWIERSRRSTSIDARSLASLVNTILSLESPDDRGSSGLQGVEHVITSGYLDALVMACRAQPDLAKRIVADGTHTDTLRTVLLMSEDEPLARAAGLDIPRTTRHADALSPRELEVFELMIQGRTNPEIARSLYISEATTKVHVRHILRKLGVRSRVEAVRAWRPTVTSHSGLSDAG